MGWRLPEWLVNGQGLIEFNNSDPDAVKACVTTMVQGKMNGYTFCDLNNGNAISGIAENNKIVGDITYKWNTSDCRNCPAEYSGTFYKGNFAIGTLKLQNGERYHLQYYPTDHGCLIWNDDPLPPKKNNVGR